MNAILCMLGGLSTGRRISHCGLSSDMRRVEVERGGLLTTSIIAPPPMASEKRHRLFPTRPPDLVPCILFVGGVQWLVLRKCPYRQTQYFSHIDITKDWSQMASCYRCQPVTSMDQCNQRRQICFFQLEDQNRSNRLL